MTTAEPIILKPLTAWEQAQAKRKTLSLPLRILTSPKTTIALGATLAGLLTAGAIAPAATGAALRAAPAVAARGVGKTAKFLMPKTAKGMIAAGIGIPVAAGLLKESPKARRLVKKTIDPREGIKRGEAIAKMIEDPKQLQEQLKEEGLWETIKTSAKKGGKYGAIAAGVLGAAAITKKAVPWIKEKITTAREKKVLEAAKEPVQLDPRMKAMGFTEPQPVGIGGIPITQPQKTLTGAPGSQISRPAIENIIQIQVM